MDPLSAFFNNTEDTKLLKLAQGYFDKGDHIKALEVIEDSISIRGKENILTTLHFLQGTIFMELARRTKNSDMKFAFLLGSVECFAMDCGVHAYSATAFLDLAKRIGSALYYKKALNYAKENLSFMDSFCGLSLSEQNTRSSLENIVQVAESLILLGDIGKDSDPKLKETKEVQDRARSDTHNVTGKRLRSYWASMDVESKRNFMKLSIVKLMAYVERLNGREGVDALEQVLDSARINRKWKIWKCRTCSHKFFYLKKFKSHLEQEHGAKFKPSTTKHMAQRVDEVWVV